MLFAISFIVNFFCYPPDNRRDLDPIFLKTFFMAFLNTFLYKFIYIIRGKIGVNC